MNSLNVSEECRACLRQLGEEKRHHLFDPWPPSAPRRGILIAQDLANLANIQISETDNFSKVLCVDCYKKLKDAWTFITTVKHTDSLLNKISNEIIESGNSSWPLPIDINQQVSGAIDNVEVEVKQEVLSEDESTEPMDTWEPTLDIKIEPEEIIAPDQSNLSVNGSISHKEKDEDGVCINGIKGNYSDEEYLEESTVKQEPLSDNEDTSHEPTALECILCMKQFYSVNGLKAHVISQHSYKTVKRKNEAPHSCVTCRETFTTRDELREHGNLHWQYKCPACGVYFPYTLLSSHHCQGQLPPIYRTYAKSNKSQPKLKHIENNDSSKTEPSSIFDASTEEKDNPMAEKTDTSEKPDDIAMDNSIADTLQKTDDIAMDNSKVDTLQKTDDIVMDNSIADTLQKTDDITCNDAAKNNTIVENCIENVDPGLGAVLETKMDIKEERENTDDEIITSTSSSELPSIEHDKENVSIENANEDKIKQNMEVLVAINPIEEASVILDSKLIDVSEKLESDNFEPKIVSVSNTCDEGSL